MLKKGQKIRVADEDAVVLGYLRFHTYCEYFCKNKETDANFWLEEGPVWKMWEPINYLFDPKFDPKAFLDVINKANFAKAIGMLGKRGVLLEHLNIREIFLAQVEDAAGQTDDTEVGEKVIGFQGRIFMPIFDFFCIEVWGEEIKCYIGRKVKVETI